MRLIERACPDGARRALLDAGVHPVLARLFAARRVRAAGELALDAARLHPPGMLKDIGRAAQFLADALRDGKRMLIIADYDADGATACALGIRALRALGAACGWNTQVDYLVPDRFKLGYGLSPELVDLAAERRPDLLITVDNGIASVAGVARALELGIATLVTDHHLPGAELPAAQAIVNPNQPGCDFPSKALAGVGVIFYTMLALRAELRTRGALKDANAPNLGALTDLVALGTVADVVPLDRNNRILVSQGLKRIRAGRGQPGVHALLRVAGRAHPLAGAFDLGFAAGPRLNAAGRLADMSLGIECLVTDDEARAANIAQELDRLNRERRQIEGGMLDEALAAIDAAGTSASAGAPAALCYYRPGWHQGVIGILASRLRERTHRPVLCFARAESGTIEAAGQDAPASGLLRGSGRSTPGLHLRDCLDLVAKRAPDLILRFGGHAAAAGLTIREAGLAQFEQLFAAAAAEMTPPEALTPAVETDGALDAAYLSVEVARMLDEQIWGQGFPQPLFCDTFAVAHQRVVGGRHLKLRLLKDGRPIEAMRFGSPDPLPSQVRAAYRLAANEYNGLTSVQLHIEHIEG